MAQQITHSPTPARWALHARFGTHWPWVLALVLALGVALGQAQPALAQTPAQAPVPAAQLMAQAGKLPIAAIKLRRDGKDVDLASMQDSGATFLACDELSFNTAQKQYDWVELRAFTHGKRLVLTRERPSLQIPCATVGLSQSGMSFWSRLPPDERRAVPVSAHTKDAQFALPIMWADRIILVEGKRSLHLNWLAGQPPYRIVLQRSDSVTQQAVEMQSQTHSAWLPETTLAPGQYSLKVFQTTVKPTDTKFLEVAALHVVPKGQLPAKPAGLDQLGANDADLVYGYYLEGLDGGQWAFEAMQWFAARAEKSPAAKQWLEQYGGVK